MKGRRLPEAAVFVDRELSRGLQEAENWTKDTFQTTRIRTLRFSVLCAGLVSHGWQNVRILAEIAVGECRELVEEAGLAVLLFGRVVTFPSPGGGRTEAQPTSA